MSTTTTEKPRPVRLFKRGRSQAVCIPREFELPGNEALIHREGNRLIVEPVQRQSLRALLASWTPLNEEMPEIQDFLPEVVTL